MSSTRPWIFGSLLAFFVACSGAEQHVVRTFLGAVQGGDTAAVRGMSLVSFPGQVSSWEILEVGPESLTPFSLADARKEFLELEESLERKTKDDDAFLQQNASRYQEIQKRLAANPDASLSGPLLELKTDLDARLEEQENLRKKVEKARQRIIDIRNAAGLSLNTSVSESFDGNVKGKVLVLRIHDGSEEKTYSFTLKRYELSDTERNITPIARWIITEIQEQV